jgi:hypothetical protein
VIDSYTIHVKGYQYRRFTSSIKTLDAYTNRKVYFSRLHHVGQLSSLALLVLVLVATLAAQINRFNKGRVADHLDESWGACDH